MYFIFKALLVTLCLSLSSLSSGEIIVLTQEIPGVHQKDGLGAYDTILKQFHFPSETLVIKQVPPARAESIFSQCSNCCLSPANKNPDIHSYKEDVFETLPMNVAKVYIFSQRGQGVIIKGIDALKHKAIGVRRGMNYGKRFANAGLSLEAVDSLAQNFGKLEKKRLDAVVAYIPDAYILFNQEKIKPFPHSIHHPITIHNDALICRGVPNDFISAFNQHIKKYRANGKLKAILGDAYVAP